MEKQYDSQRKVPVRYSAVITYMPTIKKTHFTGPGAYFSWVVFAVFMLINQIGNVLTTGIT